MDGGRQPVHRAQDGELLGYVEPTDPSADTRWRALTVFGGLLAELDSHHEAVAELHTRGIACLREKWWYYSSPDQRWRRVQLVEVRPDSVRAHNGPYPQMAETVRISGPDLATLTLALPETPLGSLPPDYGAWPE